MTRTASFTTHAAKALSRRRTIPIELPEFAIRALEHRVEMTNVGADDEEMVSFNDVVEWYLLSPLSVKEMPHLEDAVPRETGSRGDAEERRKPGSAISAAPREIGFLWIHSRSVRSFRFPFTAKREVRV
jgi:hypothetical protein